MPREAKPLQSPGRWTKSLLQILPPLLEKERGIKGLPVVPSELWQAGVRLRPRGLKPEGLINNLVMIGAVGVGIMARRIMAILSTLLEETAIVVIALWALPQIGIRLPWAVLVTLMVAWGVYSSIVYQLGSRALRRQQTIGLPDMVGSQGVVVSRLAPEGLVRIKGELWVAWSASGEMNPGEEVTVTGQERLKLLVRGSGTIASVPN